jgi:excisionase family DNA binding protein
MSEKRSAAGRQTVLLTLQQAAEQTGVPYSSLVKLVKDGHLTSVRLGEMKRMWVKRSDLERFIANSTEPASR